VSGFVDQFSECLPRMLKFLDEMEGCAVQLDRMSMGSKISTVAGSSVGAVGGVMAIVGLALAPVTAGVSLGLTMGGVGLGVTSGVNSVVTTVTEIAVNKTHQTKANEGFQSFMEDVERIQVCLDEVTNQREEVLGEDYVHALKGGAKVVRNVSTIGKGIDVLVDGLDDVGMAAARGPAALSKAARAGFITLNAVFLGLDIFLICKDSISLAKGDKSAISQFIRARAALLRSMLDAWQTMHKALLCGLLESKRGRSLLEQPLNPLTEATEVDAGVVGVVST
jgi:apolipoprotein L